MGKGSQREPFLDLPKKEGRGRDRGPLHVAWGDSQGGRSWRVPGATFGQKMVEVGDCKVRGSLGSRDKGVGGSQRRAGSQGTCGHTLGGRPCSPPSSTRPPPSSPASPPVGWMWRQSLG